MNEMYWYGDALNPRDVTKERETRDKNLAKVPCLGVPQHVNLAFNLAIFL